MPSPMLGTVHGERTRTAALDLLATGLSLAEVSRRTGVARSTLRSWAVTPTPVTLTGCSRCGGPSLDEPAYAALLGYYLGDGCLSRAARCWTLRVSCDATLPAVLADVTEVVRRVNRRRPAHHVRAPGVVVVASHWQHWPCLLPQHGPGRKHERPIVLEPWQRELVERHPGAFLRGLLHSDGARVRNWATRVVAGERRRYDYPRWQFVNASPDIRGLCCWALDLVGVAWRGSGPRTISVSRREAVARLDALVGTKA
ncbi:transcriptional regulator [Nocardioides sp. CPCC 205120]|uniref:transcriptional regulator n=1 Tax=Nocardioides sp. CPCC 205120 TaxID=3406462 RepID=UPI003B505DE8